MSGPKEYVGILVNASLYRRIPTGRTGHEKLEFYEQEAAAFGLKPVYLQLQDLEPGRRTVKGYTKVPGGRGYRKSIVPVPSVIHNRAIYTARKPSRKLDRLAAAGLRIFNRCTRYGKLQVHEVLMGEPSIRPHLPETLPARLQTLDYMMSRHPSLILKPVSGSIGKGIMKLRQTEQGLWELDYPRMSQPGRGRIRFRPGSLPGVLRRRLRSNGYLIQQLLPLARYRDRPFDLRVSVQRDETGEWQVTGIAGKVAQHGAFLTNVAQGGTALELERLLEAFPALDPLKVRRDLADLSIRVAKRMGEVLPDLADLGFDIGITEHGFPMFIESNGRDQRYSFQEAGRPDLWRATYRNPMGYSHYLSKGTKTP